MDCVPDSCYRVGLAPVLFAAYHLLFSTSPGVLFLATNANQPSRLFAASLYILSFVSALIGLGVAVDGFRRMTRHQSRSWIP